MALSLLNYHTRYVVLCSRDANGRCDILAEARPAIASEMTYIVSGGALNSQHSLTRQGLHDMSPLLSQSRAHPVEELPAEAEAEAEMQLDDVKTKLIFDS